MRFEKLEIGGMVYNKESEIEKILEEKEFYWLINSEIESANIKVEKDTIVWKSGNFYTGNWYYGIWESGKFYGNWINGIFLENDKSEFKGKLKGDKLNYKK